MGMNSHVIGIVPADAEYKKKLAAYKACQEAGVPIPMKITDFFRNEPPNEDGMEIELDEDPSCEKYSADMQDGFTIDITMLPTGVRFVRFYNSY